MSTTALSIPFSVSDSNPGLFMEQEEWGGKGKVTKLDLVRALSTVLYNGEDDPNDINCGMDGDCYLSGLYVYFHGPIIDYHIGVTHGELGGELDEVFVQELEIRELLSFSLTSEEKLKYPVHTLIDYEWGADTWDSQGNITSDPLISIEGSTVKISKKVYGTVIVTYNTIRHVRELRVPPREDVVEGVFDSYAWARWDGGVQLLELEPPDGAEERYMNNQNCIWGKIINFHPRDPDYPPPSPDSKNVTRRKDYCTNRFMEHRY